MHCTHACPSFIFLQGLIFVVDSNDRERIGEARDELMRMLAEEFLGSNLDIEWERLTTRLGSGSQSM